MQANHCVISNLQETRKASHFVVLDNQWCTVFFSRQVEYISVIITYLSYTSEIFYHVHVLSTSILEFCNEEIVEYIKYQIDGVRRGRGGRG